MNETTNITLEHLREPAGALTLVAGPRGLRAISFPGRDGERPQRDDATP